MGTAEIVDRQEAVVKLDVPNVTLDGTASFERHEQLIRLCESGDAEAAASTAFDTWHSLGGPQPA